MTSTNPTSRHLIRRIGQSLWLILLIASLWVGPATVVSAASQPIAGTE